jgi:16S rRNA (cytidine1402-2'-O)-methyltransferase
VACQVQGILKELKGTLYIVSTPIGNLEDITLRARRVLGEADVIAAEDTRRSMKLLGHLGISKPMVSYWGEKEKTKAEEVMKRLNAGLSVALISDAGTPGISDPGAVLIRRALEDGVDVVPVPGPSALVTALSISGLPTEEFTFIGFLPSKPGQRQRRLSDLGLEPRTLVFYESPHRLVDALIDMEKAFGNRKAAVIKELTKLHEEVMRGGLSDILDRLEEATIAGEYVIVVEGREKGAMALDEAVEEVLSLIRKGKGRKEAVKTVAGQYGLSRKELYERSLRE